MSTAFDDDISVTREDYDEEPVSLNTSLSNIVTVDNVPIIDMVRFEKLCSVLRRLLSQYGNVVELNLPTEGEPAKTCGYAFVEYSTVEEAQRAVAEGNNKRLDSSHILLVNSLDDFDRLNHLEEKFQPPKREDFERKANTGAWLLDANTRDQFVVRYAKETQVYWFDPLRKLNDNCREYKYGGERERENDKFWCELGVEWSPRGSYLVTYHAPGIALWGGDSFERLGRFSHPLVQRVAFSPCEKYLITSNIPCSRELSRGDMSANTDREIVIIWDAKKGSKLREFERKELEGSLPNGQGQNWPIFEWSYDGKYVARKGVDKEGTATLLVYETPSMLLIDKKSIKIPALRDFQWSPSENVISYWVPEHSNQPAYVSVMEIPSRNIRREKRIYNVKDASMYWQDQGEFLCVKLILKKGKKTTTNSLEVFRMKSSAKEIPVEVVDIKDPNQPIQKVEWEPGMNGGQRFALIYGESQTRVNISIYDAKNTIKLIKTFENRAANTISWSPAGSILVAASMGGGTNSGALEWIDADVGESITTSEHYMCNDLAWDPSGRYLLSVVRRTLGEGAFKYGMENGYRMWTMHGAPLCSILLEDCFQVCWRPRPQALLSKAALAKVRETLKEKYWKKFEQEDEEIRQTQLTGAAKERKDLRQQWKEYRAAKQKEYEEEAEARRDLRGYDSDEDEGDYVTVEQLVEEEISREEIVLN